MIPRRARQHSNVVTNTPVYKSLSPEKPVYVDHVYNQQLMLNAITHNDVNLANTLINTVHIDLDESIVWAVKNNNLEITELLIQNGADINTVYNNRTLLIYAINNNYTDLAELLILYGADINTLYDDITPMGAAIRKDNIKITALLLSLGANTQYNKNDDCVYIATINNKLEILKLLLDYGIDPNEISSSEDTALFCAAKSFKTTEMTNLLLEHEADPNIQDNYGNTALIVIMSEVMGSVGVDTTKLLLEYGADPNIQNNMGKTALMGAYNIRATKLLLEYGADPNIQNNMGKTALMESYDVDRAKLLLEYGADPNIKNNYGKVALEIVSYDIGVFLLKAGASIYKNGKIIKTVSTNLNKIIEKIHDANTAHVIGKKIFSVNNGYDPSFNAMLGQKLSKHRSLYDT